MTLLEYVEALENRDSQSRGQQVIAALQALGITPAFQEWPLPRIRNIIVDFSPEVKGKRLLLSAHYDCAKGSPAANDNASGVAVLLGLCQEMTHLRAPVRVVFFDREEAWLRTPMFRLGLLGSLYYVCRLNMQEIAAVYNLEFAGLGDFLGVWPVKPGQTGFKAVKAIEKAATRLYIPFGLTHIPWLFLSSDHLPFRLRGLSNAVTLSMLPSSQVPVMESLTARLSIARLLMGQRPLLPEPISFIHSGADSSSKLTESSLKLMLSLLLEIIKDSVSGQARSGLKPEETLHLP